MSDAVDTAPAAETAAQAEPPTLRDLLRSTEATGADITRHLDALPPEERLRQVLAVKGKWVKALYDRMADAPPVSLTEFVPPHTAGQEVIYEGRNSLAMFTRFQKRFCLAKSGRIVGYNHQSMSFVTGPGYFVVQAGRADAPAPGEPYVDYTTLPEPEELPEGWPALKSNDRGLTKTVYGNMNDFLRRVATGVVVGKAYRAGEDIDAHFSLTLAPPPPEAAS